jgi:carbon-monoxide dehydrogenase medium subunit|tara:strand:- start:1738 stop:2571 length:834 start_codon:yes stop_codon:yes gene_type:complete
LKPVAFELCISADIASAAGILSQNDGDTKIIAGGQSLGPMLNLRLARPDRLVDVAQTPALRKITQTQAFVAFGAATRHAEIEDGKTPDPSCGMMPYVASGIAYRAIRNKGTLGGSLCHADPAADWVTAMTALNATLIITSVGKDTRKTPMVEFMQGAYRTTLEPGEILTSVLVPKYSDKTVWGYYKICRKVGEFADAIVAWVADPTKQYSRIVLGAGSGAPLVLNHLAKELAQTGNIPTLDIIKAELKLHSPDLDQVKNHLFAIALQRCVKGALANE